MATGPRERDSEQFWMKSQEVGDTFQRDRQRFVQFKQ